MNTPRPPLPDAALTPEERALAERIAQTRPPREPSPALDARILAAARAAAAPGRSNAPAHRRARRRWPAVTAVAATLVLAVGIAWQLQPVEDVRVEYSEAPSAAARVVAPPGGPQAPEDTRQADVGEAAVADEAAASSVAPPPEAETAPPPEPAPQQAPQPGAESAGSRQPEAAVEQHTAPARADTGTPLVFDQPSPVDSAPPSEPRPAAFPATAATPPPAPPPPPAPAAPASPPPPAPMRTQAISAPAADAAAASEAVRAARARSESKAAPAPAARTATAIGTAASDVGRAVAAPKADAGTLDRIEVSGTRIGDFDDPSLDEQPPASADSPQVQQAWLQRVRDLVADGELEAARDSLREYRRRYPRADLPGDLRALLDE